MSTPYNPPLWLVLLLTPFAVLIFSALWAVAYAALSVATYPFYWLASKAWRRFGRRRR